MTWKSIGWVIFYGLVIAYNVYAGNPKTAGLISLLAAFVLYNQGEIERMERLTDYEAKKRVKRVMNHPKMKEAISEVEQAAKFVFELQAKGVKESYNIVKLAKEAGLQPGVIEHIKIIAGELNKES